MRFYTTAVAALALASRALALPTSKRSVSALSSSSLQGFAPFTQFARATYCGADKLKDWNCGEACKANPTFEPSLVGGDGNAIQTCECGFVSSVGAATAIARVSCPKLTDTAILLLCSLRWILAGPRIYRRGS